MAKARVCFMLVFCVTIGLLTYKPSFSEDLLPKLSNDPQIQSALEAIEKETLCYVAPGPLGSDTRPICVWRPKSSPDAVLPVLYLADGIVALEIVAVHLKPLIDQGKTSPFLIIATNAKPVSEDRGAEYLWDWDSGRKDFEAHEKWILGWVIPWAQRTQNASSERDHRFIGGFSNGADYAVVMANHHPDVFAGALIHSPVRANETWVGDKANTQRWVVTGGKLENSGSFKRGADIPLQIIDVLHHRKATLRSCIGSWSHQPKFWRQLSPGSVTWLMGLGDPEITQSELEKNNCTLTP